MFFNKHLIYRKLTKKNNTITELHEILLSRIIELENKIIRDKLIFDGCFTL